MLFRFITLIFVIGILFRLFSRYILPVFRITSVANDRIRQMQDQMKEMDRKANENQYENNNRSTRIKKEGDYIDYEEIK